MGTIIRSPFISIAGAARKLHLSDGYLRTFINNTPSIKIRQVGRMNVVSLNQLKHELTKAGIRTNVPTLKTSPERYAELAQRIS